MSPDLILYLLSWAVFYTSYDMPAEPPIIEYVTHEYMVNTPLCKGIDTVKDPCTIRALYNDYNSGVIQVDEKYKNDESAYIKSIIVHEMVHYLQDISGQWDDMYELEKTLLCQERAYRQREAYMAQDNYNQDVHSYTRLLRRNYDKCGMR
jgi:hypothetical protein